MQYCAYAGALQNVYLSSFPAGYVAHEPAVDMPA